ncbi:hypothetical protein ANN_23497 [Periplaneta americana]|uniref:C2H2-type domain-containing protein n=1 Tax=Periplaneta americana TaxID=6978 RepID=A0ABQ8SMB0_PERAM|nr:hypothetical protein ANN_23497 [Periplaneta americana]
MHEGCPGSKVVVMVVVILVMVMLAILMAENVVLKDGVFYRYIAEGSRQSASFPFITGDTKNFTGEVKEECRAETRIEEVEVVVDVDIRSDTSRGELADENSNHSTSITLESNIDDYIDLQSLSNKGKGQFYCRICYKRFTQQVNLSTHERIHTGERPYRCEICLKAFTQQSNLWKHVRIHTGERPFQCNVCPKAFAQQANLSKHQRIHTGERPYACNYCTKAFSQRANLLKHERTHTGERPYRCRFCCKAFAQQSNLDKHERVHTGIKPYSCKQCLKTFTQQNNLTKHEAVHCKEKPYSCQNCKKSYTQKILIVRADKFIIDGKEVELPRKNWRPKPIAIPHIFRTCLDTLKNEKKRKSPSKRTSILSHNNFYNLVIFYNDEVKSEDSPKDYPAFAFWLGKSRKNPTKRKQAPNRRRERSLQGPKTQNITFLEEHTHPKVGRTLPRSPPTDRHENRCVEAKTPEPHIGIRSRRNMTKAILTTRNNKAVGPDNICNKHLKASLHIRFSLAICLALQVKTKAAIMANPRKFSEKIALHNQKQAEETAAFEKIMREVSDATSKMVKDKETLPCYLRYNSDDLKDRVLMFCNGCKFWFRDECVGICSDDITALGETNSQWLSYVVPAVYESIIKIFPLLLLNLSHAHFVLMKSADISRVLEVRYIETKVAEGDIRGAVWILSSDLGVADYTHATYQALLEKHPSPWRLSSFPDPPDPNGLKYFPHGSASGIDSICPQHLKNLVSVSAGDSGKRLLTSLTNLCNFVLSGKLNPEICPDFYGASLLATDKKDGAVHLIAIGNTF